MTIKVRIENTESTPGYDISVVTYVTPAKGPPSVDTGTTFLRPGEACEIYVSYDTHLVIFEGHPKDEVAGTGCSGEAA